MKKVVYLVMGAFAVMTLTQCTKDGAVNTINALTLPKVMITHQQKGTEFAIDGCRFEVSEKDLTWIDLNGNFKKDQPAEEVVSGKKYVNTSSELSIIFGKILTLTMKNQAIKGVSITNRYITEVDFSGNKMGLLEIMNAQKLEKIVCNQEEGESDLQVKLPEKQEAIESLKHLDFRGYRLLKIDEIIKKLPNRTGKESGVLGLTNSTISEGVSVEELEILLRNKNWEINHP